jgi:hypothetical protein
MNRNFQLAFSLIIFLFSLISVHGDLLAKEIHYGGETMTKMQVEWMNADENVRHNKAAEEETYRHNVASEQLSQAANELRAQELAESVRSHQTNEALTATQLNETIRHQQAIDTETMRHNGVSEQEIAKHNRATEQIDRDANQVKLLTTQLSAAATRDVGYARADAARYAADVNKEIAKLNIASNQLITTLDRAVREKQVDSTILKDKAYIRELERRYFLDYDKFVNSQEQAQREMEQRMQEAKDNAERQRTIQIFKQVTRKNADSLNNGLIEDIQRIYDAIHESVSKRNAKSTHSRGGKS